MKRVISILLVALMITMQLPTFASAHERDEYISVISSPEEIVSTDTPIVLTFSEALDEKTVTPETVKIYKDGFLSDLSEKDISVDGAEVTINKEKVPFCKYTIEVLEGISATSGAVLGADYAFSFETTVSDITLTKTGTSVFKSALYDISNPDDVGRTKSDTGTGWLGYLYVNPKLSHLYCNLDISNAVGKNVSEVICSFFVDGKGVLNLFKVDGSFIPGETKYGDLPEVGEVVSAPEPNGTSGRYVSFDITDYAKEELEKGNTILSFMVKTIINNQTVIANEYTYSSWIPKLEIKYMPVCEPPVVCKIIPEAESRDVLVNSDIKIALSEEAESFTAENVTLAELHSGDAVMISDNDISIDDEGYYVINPSKDLDAMTVYSLKISGLTTKSGKDFSEKTIRFKTSGNSENANVYYSTNEGTSRVNVKFAEDYSGGLKIDGKLFGCGNSEIELKIIADDNDKSAAAVFESSVTADEGGYFEFDVAMDEGGDFKAYISSPHSLDMGIVTESFKVYTKSEYASVWEKLCGSDASAITPILEKAFAMFEILPQNRDIFEIYEKTAEFIAAEESFGEYNLENIEKMKKEAFKAYILAGFICEDDTEILVDAVNCYEEELGLSEISNIQFYKLMKSDKQKAVMSKFVEKRDIAADEFSDLYEDIESSIQSVRLDNIFTDIENAENYSAVVTIITNEDNAALLELSEKDIKSFKSNKSSAAKELVGEKFTSLSEFKTAFNKALKAKDKRAEQTTSSRPSGGGGGIVITTPKKEQTEEKPIIEENKNSTQLNEYNRSFDDISNYDWAEKEIEFLYRMGVIDGVGNRLYSPSSSLSREQLVKLIVEALEFEMVNDEVSFADVSKDGWYYPYIANAKARGIVNGMGDKFGTGLAVTREDMCTIAARALEAAGYKVLGESASFTDFDKVSDYAKNAVSFLAKEGIVTGMGDGSFMPQKNTTRAEAAVFIYRYLEYVKAFASTIWAAPLASLDSVEAPGEEKILADIKAKLGGKNLKHPYIHGTYDKLVEIKKNLTEGDEWTVKIYALTKQSADALLAQPPVAHNNAVSQGLISVEGRILALMTTYFMEQDEKYLNRAMEEFENLQKITTWTAKAQLDNSQAGAAIAVCYDWLYDYLSEEQRTWAVTSMKEKVLDIAYEYYKDPSKLNALRAANDNMNIWCWRDSYNHCTYNNSNLAVTALAVAHLYPEYSAFIISKNMYNIQPYFELVGRDGGHAEPVGYYGYTTGKVMNMMSALWSALGTLYDYDRYYGFRTTAYYPLYMYGVGPFAFGDCSPGVATFNSNFLYLSAKLSKNPELMGLITDRLVSSESVKVLLWYDKGEMNNIEEGAVLELDKKLSPTTGTQNVAVFRSSWDIQKGFFAAMYAGKGIANGHSDPVSGAFGIDAYGERFITPMGIGDYNYPNYWENSQNGGRWNWYEKRPEGNNCLVINPSEAVGQKVDVTANFDSFSTGAGGGYVWGDLTGVYADYVTSYKRGMKVHQSRSKILIQDEVVMPEPSQIFWSANTPGEIEILSDDTAVITLGGKKMAVKVWANVPFEFYEMAVEKLPTSPQKTEQKEIRAYRKIAIKADGVTELKLMVEFIPVATEFEIPESVSQFVPVSQWVAEEVMTKKPLLENLSVNGKVIDGFVPDIKNYNIKYETLPEETPVVGYDAPQEYEVNVTYPEGDVKSAVVEVKNGENCTYYEILFTQKPKEIDIQSLKKYTISSVSATDNDGNLPENAIDGKMETRWSASGEGQKPCLDINLGSAKNIKAIGMAFYEGAKRQSYFEIYTSNDGKEWTKRIVRGESSGKTNEIEVFELDVNARYIRYEGQQNSLNHWNSVVEFEVYGE